MGGLSQRLGGYRPHLVDYQDGRIKMPIRADRSRMVSGLSGPSTNGRIWNPLPLPRSPTSLYDVTVPILRSKFIFSFNFSQEVEQRILGTWWILEEP